MNRLITLASFVLQIIPLKNFLKGSEDPQQKKDSTMIKDVIEQAATSFELKLKKLSFQLASFLILLSVLAYSVIRLIWHLETYLMQSYGENFARTLLGLIVIVLSSQMIYAYFSLNKVIHQKQGDLIEKNLIESESFLPKSNFRSFPEKVLHQAVIGFMKGFKKTPTKPRTVAPVVLQPPLSAV